MLNIFILEDDFNQQDRLQETIKNIASQTEIKYKKLNVFGKPNQLISEINETGNHQIFFLDIEIKNEKKKGLEIARQIRNLDPYAVIVFVTTHSEFMPYTYKYRVSALDFIKKDVDDSTFKKLIQEVLEYSFEKTLHTISEDAFVYKTEKVHVQVPFKDILYFETSQTVHKVNLVTKNGQMEFYGKISDIGKSDTRLFQSHRSFVVNPENITKVDRKNRIIYFEKNRSCFFSRLKQKKLISILECK